MAWDNGSPPTGRSGGRGLAPLTYKQGMYTRLPTITSMNSSGEQSSRKSTSALKISEGLRLRAICVPVPLVPSQMRAWGTEQEITPADRDLRGHLLARFHTIFKCGEPLTFLFTRNHNM